MIRSAVLRGDGAEASSSIVCTPGTDTGTGTVLHLH